MISVGPERPLGAFEKYTILKYPNIPGGRDEKFWQSRKFNGMEIFYLFLVTRPMKVSCSVSNP